MKKLSRKKIFGIALIPFVLLAVIAAYFFVPQVRAFIQKNMPFIATPLDKLGAMIGLGATAPKTTPNGKN